MKYFAIIFFLLFSFAFISCNTKQDKAFQNKEVQDAYLNPREDQSMQRSRIDSVAVLHNVAEYLEKLKNNDIEAAMAMLYEASGDTVLPISKQNRDRILQVINVFPVLDYQIDQLLMFSETDTEVRYSVKYFEKDESDSRPNTIQCVINPRRVGYYWYLTIPTYTMETSYRDEPSEGTSDEYLDEVITED